MGIWVKKEDIFNCYYDQENHKETIRLVRNGTISLDYFIKFTHKKNIPEKLLNDLTERATIANLEYQVYWLKHIQEVFHSRLLAAEKKIYAQESLIQNILEKIKGTVE